MNFITTLLTVSQLETICAALYSEAAQVQSGSANTPVIIKADTTDEYQLAVQLQDIMKQQGKGAPVATNAPQLEIDKILYPLNGIPHARGIRERRIVWNLFIHLAAHGWMPDSVYDGEEDGKVKTAIEAMELIFNLDESRAYFRKGRFLHSVLLVGGNDGDIISDWTYGERAGDDFAEVMNSFDAEQFA